MRVSITKIKHLAHKLLPALLWLGGWQAASMAVDQQVLLPSPTSVALRLWQLVLTSDFWATVAQSLLRISTGFLLGLLCGCLLAVLTLCIPWLEGAVRLPIGVIKAAPVASFVILALVWLRGPMLSVFIAFLMVLPLVWSNVHEGLHRVDEQLLEAARVYHLPPWAMARAVYLPAALPYFLSACQVALGFAWKAGIAGEVIAIARGTIGEKLYEAKAYLQMSDLFAWTVVIVALSMAIEALLKRATARAAVRLGIGQNGEEQP